MGVSIFPILEGRENFDDIPKEFWHVEWKDLVDCIDQLDDKAESLSFIPLGDFTSYSRADAIQEYSQ